MKRRPPLSLAPRRGSVLVVVLVTLLFAALLLTQLIETSGPDLIIAMRLADRDRLRADAYGALETTLAALEDFRVVDGGLYAPTQGWSDPLGYAGYAPRAGVTVDVAFEDESAKLSLPRLNLDTLNTLLVQLGLSVPDAARVADALFVWTHNGHIAAESATSAEVYEQADPPAEPPYRSLRSFDELAGIAVARDFFYEANGQPKPLLDAFKQAVSLYRFDASNLNSAPDIVLLASGWDISQSGALQKYLATPVSATRTRPYLRSLREVRSQVGNVSTRNLGAQVQVLRINVTARQGAAQLQVSALVTWANQASLPASLAVSPENATAATATQPAASSNGQAQPPAVPVNTANSLRYPFTVLEILESTPSVTPPPPDAPAA
ncbi:MAG: type II secretory protein PulK [Lacunisphaera sp.]